MRVANKLTPKPKSKMAEIMPEHTGREQPPMRIANKITLETKSKMAEIMPERTGREQKSRKHA